MANEWQKEVVVLTGGIGSGKSSVSKILSKLGAFVVNADDLAREAVSPGSKGLAKIVEAFGRGVLKGDGSLNRAELGRIIFADQEKRKVLEAITHPLIEDLAKTQFVNALSRNEPLLLYECPLLFEAKLEKKGFKKIVLVTAPEELCRKRVMERDKLTSAEVGQRFSAQSPQELKLAFSDYVINNSGSLQQLEVETVKLFNNLLSN